MVLDDPGTRVRLIFFAPDPAQPATGQDDCQVLAAVGIGARLHILAQAAGLRQDGHWAPEDTYHLRATWSEGPLTFRSGSTGESDVERTTINAVYLFDEPHGQVLEATLERGSTPIHQARLVRAIEM